MQRRLTPERMDDPCVPREQLASSLAYLRSVNARLGGVSALLRRLKAWSRSWPGSSAGAVTLIDLATGGADIPIAARRWALRAGFDLRITGIDTHETTLAIAREAVEAASRDDPRIGEGITLRRLDARALVDAFGPGSFDYAHASLFLHHLPEIEVLTVLRIMDRLARRGLVWSDLHRSRLHRLAACVATLGAPEIVRHDARVSVEAGFTRREALDIAGRVGLQRPSYRRPVLWYRFTLTSEKG